MELDLKQRYMLTLNQAAMVLGLPKSSIYMYAKDGRLPFPVMRIGNSLRVKRSDLEEFLAASTTDNGAA